MKKLKIIIFLLISLHSVCVNAKSKNIISSCKQGAKAYASYSLYIDNYYLKLKNEGRLNKENIETIDRQVEIMHEKFKEREADSIYKAMNELLAEGGRVPEELEVWRRYMELTIDWAYLEAMRSVKAGNIGRSEDFYERKIYDSCVR